MGDFCLYVLYRAGVAIVRILPLGLLYRLGELFGFFAWLILPGYRRLALRNVTIAFGGEKSRKELKRLVRRHFQRLGANLLSGIKVATLPLAELHRHVEVVDVDLIDRHLREKRGVVVVLSHLGNWELISQALPKFIGHARNSTIYQPLSNRRIDAHVRSLRARAGVQMFDRNSGFDAAIKLLREGGAIGILTDQHAGDQGVWVPMFDKLASTTPLPALLAKRSGSALVNVAVYTEGVGRWRIQVTPGPEVRGKSVDALTAVANEAIAGQIRRSPQDWFWVHDRWKTPNPNLLLAGYKRGVYLPATMSSPDLKPFRILIRASNWLGDAVMSVPAVRAIKLGRPDAHLTVVTPANLSPVWQLIKEVDEIVPLDGKSLLGAVRAIEKKGRFDVAVLFPNSLRAALEVWLADVPRRIGYRGHWRKWLLNHVVHEGLRRGPPLHHSLRYLRIAEAMGADHDSASGIFALPPDGPATTPAPAPDKQGTSSRRRLALCPGAEYGPAKRWLPERFAEVARTVAEKLNAEWILLGTARDENTGRQIAALLEKNFVNRIGQTTLQDLIAELRSCELLLTNDTGTMHLAALLGIPVVATFGSTEPALTGPFGNRHVIIRHHVECSPCFLRECPIDFRCMRAIEVAEVLEAVQSLLQQRVVVSAS